MRPPEIYKYNPRLCSPEELEATFVARQAILDGILGDLRARASAPANQHVLLIGPRGIGKTNLLLMIRKRIREDEALARAYVPLQTAEEEYSIASLRDLFGRILELLSGHSPDPDLLAARESARTTRDDEQAAELAIEAAKRFSERSGQKLLLLVDNLDLILGDQLTDDAQLGRLRDLLMNGSFLVLIGAAPTYFEEVSGYGRPFYNFFKTIDLQDLSVEQVIELLRKRAELDGNRAILDRLADIRPRIQAVHHLTGGNPRLVLMLYQLCTASELPEVRAAVQALLDDMTPYYKGRIEALAPQQRQVLDTFARLGRPATPTELADETRLPVNQINAILKRLREHGFVSLAPQERRKKSYYMVSEQVFRIWHQMRFAPSTRRLQFLIEFIRVWYSPPEWTQEANRLLGAYRATAAERRFEDAGRFIEHLGYMAEAAPSRGAEYVLARTTIAAAIESGDHSRAEVLLEDFRRRNEQEGSRALLADAWGLTAHVYYVQGRLEQATDALSRAVELRPDFPEALYNWGVAVADMARTKSGAERETLYRQACRKYEEALRIKPGMQDAIYNWGLALGELAEMNPGPEREALLRHACDRYEEAVSLNPDLLDALTNWGAALTDLALTQSGAERQALLRQACSKYEKAIRIKSDEHTPLYNWGFALSNLAETVSGAERSAFLGQACEKYEEALRLKPDDYEPLNNWGNALADLAETKEGAEQEALFRQAWGKYEEAVRVRPDRHGALYNWGNALTHQAFTTSTAERVLHLRAAEEKVRAAIEAARSMDDREDAAFYAADLVIILLAESASAAFAGNQGDALAAFTAAMEQVPQAEGTRARDGVVDFFRLVAREDTAALCAQFLGALRERGMEEELATLEPFAKAVEYWQKGRDTEVLDRLNPEVRQIVEQIVGLRTKADPPRL